MMDILGVHKSTQTFVVEPLNGLTGLDVMASFPCLLYDRHLYVWVGNTDLRYFGRSTLMNLINLAEGHEASDINLMLSSEKVSQYARTMKMIDAERYADNSGITLYRLEI